MRKLLCFVLGTGILTLETLHGQINDPIPDSISQSGLRIELEDFVRIPPSAGSAPLARINLMKPSKDGSARLFVNDLRGKLHVVADGKVSTYLDLADKFSNFKDSPGLGTGFGSFAFHPEFSANGKFYTTHAEEAGSGKADLEGPLSLSPSLQGVITEWTADNPSSDGFSGMHRELLRIDIPGTIHGLQDMAFNPNAAPGDPDYGMLYICLGDGGSTIAGFPDNTHRLDSILGTIMRIDPLDNDGRTGQYGIPPENPFASDDNPDTLDEIWAYGFRNPHRISWDTGGDGKMLIGSIGEKNIEEINLGVPGADYGWNVREGTFRINPDFTNNPEAGNREEIFPLPENDAEFGFAYPVAQYDHDEGRAVVGGFVYRGSAIPDLVGKYVFGDIVNGRIFYAEADDLVLGSQAEIKELELTRNGRKITLLGLLEASRADLRFGFDPEGELYVLTKQDGWIRKMVPAEAAPPPEPGLDRPSGWLLLDDFEDGDISDWVLNLSDPDIDPANPPEAKVIEEPNGDSGKILSIFPGGLIDNTVNFRAYKEIPKSYRVSAGTESATLYFKVSRPLVDGVPAEVDTVWGLTPVVAPSAYSDYSVLGRYEKDGGMDIRDESKGGYVPLEVDAVKGEQTPFETDVFYELWFVMRHGENRYDLYIRGGENFPVQTFLYTNAMERNATFDDLINFLITTSTGNSSNGSKGRDPTYFDDIYIDPSQQNLSTPEGVLGGVSMGGDFLFSTWYGIYNATFYPWIYHLEHGWQYVFAGEEPGRFFLYDLESNDFWWTRSDFEPFTFYSFNRGTFNFYFSGTSDPREFVDLQSGEFYVLP